VIAARSSLALLLCAPLCAAAWQRFEFFEPHMGTLFRITLYAPDAAAARSASAAAFARVRQLDNTLSDYKEDSELMRLCRDGWQSPVPLSVDLFRVLSAAQKLARETGGAFDVTQGPLIRLWRAARRDGQLPAADRIEEARRLSGYEKLKIDPERQTAFLKSRGMVIDLGGIAKGFAADEALRTLRERGIGSALVAASGDLALGDAPPGRSGWSVRVEPGGIARTLTLRNVGVSTSGDAEQFLESDGVRYSHIVDPRSGMGLTSRIGVTVIAPAGITADSLATAVSVLGSARGAALIRKRADVSAWIAVDGRLIEAGRRR
jgi:thiamine biosynthesis lipoprotein